ncbi:MAG: MFS transporter [Granulosicoccus sp.]
MLKPGETVSVSTSTPAGCVPLVVPDPRRWAAMAVLFLASFMNVLDVSIVNVALPDIRHRLGASSTELQWVLAVYVLAFAAGLLPFGRFGDVLGRKRLFMLGLSGFTLGSLMCGVASTIEILIIARLFQGIAGAMMVPQVLAIVHVIFPANEKPRAFALFGTVTSLGAVMGPLVGGALVSADIADTGWRSIFLVNVPFGLLALVAGQRLIPNQPSDRTIGADPLGMALFAITIMLLVFPLIEGRDLGWPWWSFAMMAAALPMALAFRRWQDIRARRALAELLPATLLAEYEFVVGIALVTLFFSGIPGLFLILAVFFQSGFGFTAFQSGLATLPFPVGVMLAFAVTGHIGPKRPVIRVTIGALLLAIGMLILQLMLRRIGTSIDVFYFAVPLLICGAGTAITIASLFQSVLAAVAGADAGAGSGALQSFQQIGSALGIALVGQIFFSTLSTEALSTEVIASTAYVEATVAATWYPIAAFATIMCVSAWRALHEDQQIQSA